jgi:hypothetical protein
MSETNKITFFEHDETFLESCVGDVCIHNVFPMLAWIVLQPIRMNILISEGGLIVSARN